MTKEQESKERIRLARQKIRQFSESYYNISDPGESPEISDAEFDALVQELKQLEAKHPDLVKESPAQLVGAKPSGLFKPVVHDTRMASLENIMSLEKLLNTKSVEELEEQALDGLIDQSFGELNTWFNRKDKQEILGRQKKNSFVCELKIDGFAISVLYEKGRLVRAATRGDGNTGEDVTGNVLGIEAIPKSLPARKCPDRLEVRGEIYMPLSEFKALNAGRAKRGLEAYPSPRNTAAGSLRQKDPAAVVIRPLSCWWYQVGEIVGGPKFDSHSQSLEYISDLGLPVNSETEILSDVGEVKTYLKQQVKKYLDYLSASEERPYPWEYDVDGVVVKLDSLAVQEQVGATSHHPNWAVAYKFPAEEKPTKLNDIKVSIGAKGKVTPFAELEPVFVGGATVRVATLHNEDQVKEKDVRPGDTVIVRRAGHVIPEVVRAVLKERPKNLKPWVFPKLCPCDRQAKLVRLEGEAAHHCPDVNCPFQKAGRIEHFVSRGAMDIEGLGESWVEEFAAQGQLKDVADIYNLDFEEIARLEVLSKLGEHKAEKIIQSIDATKSYSLEKFLSVISIPSVGPKNAKNLAEKLGGKVFTAPQQTLAKAVGKSTANHVFTFSQANAGLLGELRQAGVKCIPNSFAQGSFGEYEEPGGDQLSRMLVKFIGEVGEKVAEQLVNSGLIARLSDIYSLSAQQLAEIQVVRTFGPTNAKNLKNRIEKSKTQPLSKVLFGLNIAHIGSVTASLLAEHFGDMDRLIQATASEMAAIDGVGEVLAESISNFMSDRENLAVIKKLKKAGVNMAQPKIVLNLDSSLQNTLEGKTIVVSGTLTDYGREEVSQIIIARGGKSGSGVSSKTDYLVTGNNPGAAKLQKAQELEVPILSEEEFLELLEGKSP